MCCICQQYPTKISTFESLSSPNVLFTNHLPIYLFFNFDLNRTFQNLRRYEKDRKRVLTKFVILYFSNGMVKDAKNGVKSVTKSVNYNLILFL